ncbi:MAG: hypothetical protein WDW38_006970 [Sanguina aurantia]
MPWLASGGGSNQRCPSLQQELERLLGSSSPHEYSRTLLEHAMCETSFSRGSESVRTAYRKRLATVELSLKNGAPSKHKHTASPGPALGRKTLSSLGWDDGIVGSGNSSGSSSSSRSSDSELESFVDVSLGWLMGTSTILPCDHTINHVTLFAQEDTPGRYAVAINLHNSAAQLPNMIFQLLQLIVWLPHGSIFVSCYESESTDNTVAQLQLLRMLLLPLDVPNSITTNGQLRRGPAEPRIQFLAAVRNLALEPVLAAATASVFQAEYVIFINDIFFCFADTLRLMQYKRGMACGMDFFTSVPSGGFERRPDLLIGGPTVLSPPPPGPPKMRKRGQRKSSIVHAVSVPAPSPAAAGEQWPATKGAAGASSPAKRHAPARPHTVRGNTRLLVTAASGATADVAGQMSAAVPPVPEAAGPVSTPAAPAAAASASAAAGVAGAEAAAGALPLHSRASSRPSRGSEGNDGRGAHAWVQPLDGVEGAQSEPREDAHGTARAGRESAGVGVVASRATGAGAVRRLAHSGKVDHEFMDARLRLLFYDKWITRDQRGGLLSNFAPYSSHPLTAVRLAQGLPVPVYCCWNGMVVLSMKPFAEGLRFRSHMEGECAASECSLLCDDMHRMGYNDMVMDPGGQGCLLQGPDVTAVLTPEHYSVTCCDLRPDSHKVDFELNCHSSNPWHANFTSVFLGDGRQGEGLVDVDAQQQEQETKPHEKPAGHAPPTSSPNPQPTKKQKRAADKLRQHDAERRAFDCASFRQRRVALEVLYVGWDMQGFARQDHTENTVEGFLFKALRHVRLISHDCEVASLDYSRCGRTDKGVSALGQVVSLLVRSNARVGAPEITDLHTELDYSRMLNRALPATIRVLGWAPVTVEFNARFSARFREYKYFIVQDGSLDLSLMREAASLLIGSHDYRNFCKADVTAVRSFERTIIQFDIDEVAVGTPGANICALTVKGSAFLWHQVRCMAAVLLMVGRGQEQPAICTTLLDITLVNAKPQYNLASEDPLLLHAAGFAGFQPGEFRRSHATVDTNVRDLKAMRDHHLIGAAIAVTSLLRIKSDPRCSGPEDTEPSGAACGSDDGKGGGSSEHEVPPSTKGSGAGGKGSGSKGGGGGGGGGGAQAAPHQPLLSRTREPSIEQRAKNQGIPWPYPAKPDAAGGRGGR